MQVTQVNSSATSALSPNPAEDQVSRADDFARVLQTAFYGQGGEAVAKTTERAVTEAAPRGETRNDSRPDTRADTRSETRTENRASDTRPAETAEARRDDEAAPRSEPAPRESTASKPADKPAAKDDKPAEAAAPKQDEAAPKAETPKADGKDAAPAQTGDKAETEEKPTDEATKPVVIAAPDAALILSLLQTQVPAAPSVVPVVPQGGEAVAATPAVPAVNPLDAAAAALAAAAAAMQGEVPTKTAQVAAPAATAMPAAVAPDVAATPAAPVVAAPAATAPATAALTADAAAAMAKAATETSAAALLSQQQTVTPEDAATIQQALAAQAATQPQVQVQVAPAPQLQSQVQVQVAAGKPALPADAAPKSAETKPAEKTLSLDVQAAPVVAPKTLVDQSAFFAMQNDDQPAGDAALLNQQAQVAQQVQVAATETKFNAALVQANADAQLQANVPAAPAAANSAQPQQVVPMSNPGTPAPQAAQHATTQSVARQLGAFVPAGEQVAVQIKKGVNEGVDKISIKLDPGNLGKVEVKLEVGHDGRLMAVIAADKPETLQMLQQDAGKLEQSLRDAGLKTDQQSLNFTLRDQGQANDGREARDGNGGNGRRGRGGADDYAETGHRTDPAQVAAASAQRAAAARGGLDIRI